MSDFFGQALEDVPELLWFRGSVDGSWFGSLLGGGEGEDLVEATVVGDQLFLDELFSGETDFGGVELEVGLELGVTVEAQSLFVGSEAEEDVEELCAVAEVGEEAVCDQAEGDPGKGFLDGSEAVRA